MIEIRTGDRRAAFDVPFAIYDRSSPYVSPMWSDVDRILDPARNPFVTDNHGRLELFTAHRGSRLVGRIVASLHDASNRRHGTSRGQFGFFDCIDDPDVSQRLLSSAEAWVGERGANEIVGNFNLTAMQMVGVTTDGFERAPYTDMMWSPPHIAALLERGGYERNFPMTTFENDLDLISPEALMGPRQKAIDADPDFTWHPITRWNFKQSMEVARKVLNQSFNANPIFVPLTEPEFTFQAGEMMWILDPRLSVIVHYRGRPAGVIVCIPDLNPPMRACGSRMTWSTPWHLLKHRLKRDRAVIIYYAVIPELQGKGLNGAMLARLGRRVGHRVRRRRRRDRDPRPPAPPQPRPHHPRRQLPAPRQAPQRPPQSRHQRGRSRFGRITGWISSRWRHRISSGWRLTVRSVISAWRGLWRRVHWAVTGWKRPRSAWSR